jgi:hypothetical protein
MPKAARTSQQDKPRKLVIDQPDFRAYEPQWVTGPHGVRMLIRECEELVDGRWEGFVSIRKGARAIMAKRAQQKGSVR